MTRLTELTSYVHLGLIGAIQLQEWLELKVGMSRKDSLGILLDLAISEGSIDNAIQAASCIHGDFLTLRSVNQSDGKFYDVELVDTKGKVITGASRKISTAIIIAATNKVSDVYYTL